MRIKFFYLLIGAFCLFTTVDAQPNFLRAVTIGVNSSYSDTDADGKQVFFTIGDSNCDGRGTTLGPTTSAGTTYLWNSTDLTEITTADISNGGAGNGTMWKQFALNYNARTGFKPVFVQEGSGGSNFYPDGDLNNWYSSGGNLYEPAKNEAKACLAYLGLTRLKGIIINLGINDLRAGTTLSNVQLGINSLVARLKADFPGVPIMFFQMGRSETVAFDASSYAIRGYLIDAAKNNINVWLLNGPNTGVGLTGSYNGDLLHYSQQLNNQLGAMVDRFFANKDTYSKWATSIISSMFDDLSSTRKTAIQTFIDAEIANGNYWKMEYFGYFKTTVQENCFIDWSFNGYLFNNTSITFSANSYLSSNGTSNHYAYTFMSGVSNRNASQTDFINGVFVLDNLTASGTSATLFGGGNATSLLSVGQNTTPAQTWRANDATISTYTTEGSFVDGNFYGTGRNSGTKYLYKNSTQVTSASVASTGTNNTVLPLLGAFNNNGSISSRISAQYQYFVCAPLTTFDLSSFLTNANALVAAW